MSVREEKLRPLTLTQEFDQMIRTCYDVGIIMKIDLNKLRELEAQNYLTIRAHNTHDLFICNYTAKCQYEPMWTEETLLCRGLIIDSQGNIIARPFKKFFNLSEAEVIPNGDFDVYEKYDGSLGILYWIDGEPFIATRGSFNSDQARKGSEIIRKYDASKLNREHTYLFEIIYPSNRIVVDYGDHEKLILLAIIDTKTGQEMPLESDLFETAKLYDGLDLETIKQIKNDKDEGFVLRWPDGFRLKFKFEEYVRLHRLLTQCTARSIWDLLRQNKPLDELIERVPDEFYQWVKEKKTHLENEFKRIEADALKGLASTRDMNRKNAAFKLIKEYPETKHLIFKMLDGKDYESDIWKMLYPTHEVPFKQEI